MWIHEVNQRVRLLGIEQPTQANTFGIAKIGAAYSIGPRISYWNHLATAIQTRISWRRPLELQRCQPASSSKCVQNEWTIVKNPCSPPYPGNVLASLTDVSNGSKNAVGEIIPVRLFTTIAMPVSINGSLKSTTASRSALIINDVNTISTLRLTSSAISPFHFPCSSVPHLPSSTRTSSYVKPGGHKWPLE